jgi:hypothetical protein
MPEVKEKTEKEMTRDCLTCERKWVYLWMVEKNPLFLLIRRSPSLPFR